MGFFDTLGEMAGNAINKNKEIFEKTTRQCEVWDDEKIFRAMRSCTHVVKKMAYMKVLQSRGYTTEEVNGRNR